jgi:hypothetical protein
MYYWFLIRLTSLMCLPRSKSFNMDEVEARPHRRFAKRTRLAVT